MSRFAWLVMAVLLCVSPAAQAQGLTGELETARQLVRDLRENDAIKLLNRLRHEARSEPEQLAKVYFVYGLAHSGLAQEKEAIESFRNARALDPSLRLEEDWGPRVAEWWAAAGGTRALPSDAPPRTDTPPPVVLQPGATAPPAAPLPEPVSREPDAWRPPRWLGFTLAAVAVGAGATGAVLGADAASMSRRSAETLEVRPALELHRQARGRAATANVFFIGAGAFALAGGGMLWFSYR
jgi:hypothetical protein